MKRYYAPPKKEENEVLILGAFGCGAFHNPPELVAQTFKNLIRRYCFETIEFAVFDRAGSPVSNFRSFEQVLRPLIKDTAALSSDPTDQ